VSGSWILLANAAATLFMTGVIWFVQLAHYPLLDGVGKGGFAGYERRNTRRTTWVVAPPMLIEAATTLLLAWRPGVIPALEARVGLALLVAIWVSTAALQVPCHRRLEAGFDGPTHRRLVRTNWIRVAGWSGRAALVLSWLP